MDLLNTYVKFIAIDSIAQGFLCLLFLIIHHIEVSALQLQRLVSTCEKLQSLSFDYIKFWDPKLIVNYVSLSLKSFSLRGMWDHGYDVILAAPNLNSLHLLLSKFKSFKLMRKKIIGLIHILRIVYVQNVDLDLGNKNTNDFLKILKEV